MNGDQDDNEERFAFPLSVNEEDHSDGNSVSELFLKINNLALVDQHDRSIKDDTYSTTAATVCTTGTSRSEQRKFKRQSQSNNGRRGKGKSNKSQHSLEHLRQRVSQLMSIFEENGWFIPLPSASDTKSTSNQTNARSDSSNKKGKVWSNRNYGADKKRQRKHSERHMIEARVAQLESVLRDDHGVINA